MNRTCKDCKYYLAIDVFRGLCKQTKAKIGPDSAECVKFEQLPQCRVCKNYAVSPADPTFGSCLGQAVAYASMNGQYCSLYAAK